MRKSTRNVFLFAIFVLLFGMSAAEALGPATQWNDADPPTIVKPAEPNRLPLTGYFEKPIGDAGRTAKVYIAANAPIRSYFTVIAVPDGVSAETFLQDSGWVGYADTRKEGLYILEPGGGGWGTLASEQDYVNAAMTWLSSSNMKVGTENASVAVLSTFGIHYFVGYGKGSAPLEAWVARNPLHAIAQAYVDSEGVDAGTLASAGATKSPTSAGFGYANITAPVELTYAEVVMPSFYVTGTGSAGKIAASLQYWRTANDAPGAGTANGGKTTYYQDLNSKRWMTDFWNKIRKEKGEQNGFSKVAVKTVDSLTDYTGYTEEIIDFLTEYTRYENGFAYGNVLCERANYEDLGIAVKVVNVPEAVNSKRREYMVYVPDGYASSSERYPLVIVYPGNSQTDRVFLDATQWWDVAKKNNFIMAVLCEDYAEGNPTTVGYGFLGGAPDDTDVFTAAALTELKRDYRIDETRIYLTGQSAGSMASQSIAIRMPEEYAAVASTSGVPPYVENIADKSGGAVPIYLMYGEGDMDFCAAGIWNIPNFEQWTEYHVNNWGLELGEERFASTNEYTFTDTTAGSIHGYQTWTWSLPQDVPVVRVTKTDNRGHNCHPAEMQVLWDFLKHYRNDNGRRYYDSTEIKPHWSNSTDVPRPFPTQLTAAAMYNAMDPLRPYKEVFEGLWAQSATYGPEGNTTTREFYVYIPVDSEQCEKPIYIVMPDGVEPGAFINDSGWKTLAEDNNLLLFLFKPKAEGWDTDAVGGAGGDLDYIGAAYTAANRRLFYNIHQNHFSWVGYGAGAHIAHKYVMAHPWQCDGLALINESPVVGQDYMDSMADAPTLDPDIKANEVAVPIWIVSNNTESHAGELDYWKAINLSAANPETEADGTLTYRPTRVPYAPEIEDPAALVKVTRANNAAYGSSSLNSKVFNEFLITTNRYTNQHNNSLPYDYAAGSRGNGSLKFSYSFEELGVERQEIVVAGRARVWYEYVPPRYRGTGTAKLPLVIANHGDTQSGAIFMNYSDWWKIADKYGFIVASPSGYPTQRGSAELGGGQSPKNGWDMGMGTPIADDVAFFEALIDNVAGRRNLDRGRVYITGQSAGSAVSFVAAARRPDLFAAQASTSAPFLPTDSFTSTAEIPVWLVIGEHDIMSLEGAREPITYWIERNHTVGFDDGQVYSEDTYDNGTQTMLEHTFHHSVYVNSDDIPMVRCTWTSNRPHSNIQPEMWNFWTEWFSRYSRAEDGTLVYSEAGRPEGGGSGGCDTGLSFSFAAVAALLSLVVLKKH
ncbi:MAG: hypothetical protein LBR71_05070 [Synergistaceae bacterium]|jgi:poly(3-hydroxybutyrate) depolymerase|nr:hypothetical protein [Synergistaceae bacterium]